ncbi:MAG: hypothetical protein LRY55_14315 [Leadbetterella sp.]|nr:hypothetical protein [Leadbetterella sp.]
MKNFVLILLFAVILTACKDPNIGSEDKTTEELLVAHGWQLDKFTDTQGVMLVDGQLEANARLLFNLVFDFKKKNIVWGIDKENTDNVTRRGVWTLENDNKTIDVDIEGFADKFDILQLNNTTLILQAQNKNRLTGVGPEVLMVFSEFKL